MSVSPITSVTFTTGHCPLLTMMNPQDPLGVEQTISSYSFKGAVADPAALSNLEFYAHHFSPVEFRGLGGNKQVTLGSQPFKCRFCHGQPPNHTFKKRAHAISELLGNKVMKSLYECDTCNERFRDFEDDLAKMTLPYRNLGAVVGKNGVPTLVAADSRSGRVEARSDGLHFSHAAGDGSFVEDPINKTLTFTYAAQPYRRLGAYKALCKSAFTLLPEGELAFFEELRRWLLQPDLITDRVYSRGLHFCYSTLLTAFRPFPQPIVSLLKRKERTDAPYMSFFIATGNFSYQIFLPCPAMDSHLQGKEILIPPFPHLFQLQPWRSAGRTIQKTLELSDPERTSEKTGTITWGYGEKIKVR